MFITMLAKLKMYVTSDDFEITRHISSLLHGVIMSVIDTNYAYNLHNSGLNPFSISLTKAGDEWCWTVCTVGIEAYNKIFKVLADESFSSFTLMYKDGAVVNIIKKEISEIPLEKLLKTTFFDEPSSILKISFNTPTAFKRQGDYVIMPELRLIYQSLMKKATGATNDSSFFDEDTLEALIENSRIISYRLSTVRFPLEGSKITGFTGIVSIYIKGPSLLKNYAKTLFQLGEYLGVGIKASLGMGALSIKEDN